MPYFVYILECADKTLYTGSTCDLTKRIYDRSNTKAGAKYTRGRRPAKLVYSKRCKTLSKVRAVEAEIKNLTRLEKEGLIKSVL